MKYKGISIIKNKNCNTWYARYRFNGKQFYISAKTQKECYNKLKTALKITEQQKLKNISNQIENKQTNNITLEEWYNKWLNAYKADVKEGTIREYKICLNHLEKLKNIPLNKITSIDILEQLNKITGGRTKQKVYEFANALFLKALANDFITKNPLASIEKPKHKRINGKALSSKDEKDIEKILIENNADMFLICLYQGLRKGEMLALTIDDIDFNNKTININKSLNYKNKISNTKNIYSNRIMPIFDKTFNILLKYKNIKGRIFNISYLNCDRLFNKILPNEKYNYTIHSLRHTFITRCQEAGVPLHIIQKWVGHNIGSTITNTVYTHSRENAELENIKIYNNYIN